MSLELAPRGDRALAKSLDGFITGLPLFVLASAAFILSPSSQALGPWSSGAFGLFFLVLCYQVWLLATRGQTIGKRIMRLRIVRQGTGELPGFGRAVGLRCWLNIALTMIPLYSLLDVLFIFREDRRCLHDLLAGTDVVKVEPPPAQ